MQSFDWYWKHLKVNVHGKHKRLRFRLVQYWVPVLSQETELVSFCMQLSPHWALLPRHRRSHLRRLYSTWPPPKRFRQRLSGIRTNFRSRVFYVTGLYGNSEDKLRHTRSVVYSVELVLLNKHQISVGGAKIHCCLGYDCAAICRRTSDSDTCDTADWDSRWRRFWLVSGTTSQAELCLSALARNILTYLVFFVSEAGSDWHWTCMRLVRCLVRSTCGQTSTTTTITWWTRRPQRPSVACLRWTGTAQAPVADWMVIAEAPVDRRLMSACTRPPSLLEASTVDQRFVCWDNLSCDPPCPYTDWDLLWTSHGVCHRLSDACTQFKIEKSPQLEGNFLTRCYQFIGRNA